MTQGIFTQKGSGFRSKETTSFLGEDDLHLIWGPDKIPDEIQWSIDSKYHYKLVVGFSQVTHSSPPNLVMHLGTQNGLPNWVGMNHLIYA